VKAYLSAWVKIGCPSCEEILYRTRTGNLLFCSNPDCAQYLKEYKVPSFELEPVVREFTTIKADGWHGMRMP